MRSVLLIPVMILGLTAVACSSSSKSTSASSSGTSSTSSSVASSGGVTIKNFSFAPPTLTVKVGQPVQIMNQDDTDHTVTADDGSFDTGHIAGKSGATVTPMKVGTVHYHCNIHNYMTGTLQVSS